MSTASSYKEQEMTPLLSTTWARADITTGARLKGKKPKERVNLRKLRRPQEELIEVLV